MNLPDVFQFRIDNHKGYTHIAQKNAQGDYEIKWARGWHKVVKLVEWVVAEEFEVKDFVRSGGWIIVDDTPKAPVKQEEFVLPDEFYFQCFGKGMIYKSVRKGDKFYVSWKWEEPAPDCPSFCFYAEQYLMDGVKSGDWKIIDKPSLTHEQIRFNKEYNEQIRALESSIKLSQQSEEHQKRLQQQYQERIDALKAKLVEEF